jgi:hypothetical protein
MEMTNSESGIKLLWQPLWNAMGQLPSPDSFNSTLWGRAAATEKITMSVTPRHPGYRKVIMLSEKDNECGPVPLASM